MNDRYQKRIELYINTEKFEPHNSLVIINRMYQQKKDPVDYFRHPYDMNYLKKFHIKYKGLNSKQIFKKVFGPQLICINYTHRCWIWTFTNEDTDAVVYCLIDVRGIHWEYKKKSRFDNVIAIVQEIEERLITYEETD